MIYFFLFQQLQLEMVGGRTWQKMIFSVMEYVLSNVVAVLYSYDGKASKKKPFKERFLSKAIKGKVFSITAIYIVV